MHGNPPGATKTKHYQTPNAREPSRNDENQTPTAREPTGIPTEAGPLVRYTLLGNTLVLHTALLQLETSLGQIAMVMAQSTVWLVALAAAAW